MVVSLKPSVPSILPVDCLLDTCWSHKRPWDCLSSAKSWGGGDSYTQLLKLIYKKMVSVFGRGLGFEN